MPRVLFWSERFWPTVGGVGLSAGRLLPALAKRGYEFIVVTLSTSAAACEEDEHAGIPVVRMPFWTAIANRDVERVVQLRQRIARLKRRFVADLVHLNFLGPSTLFHLQTTAVHPAPLLVSLDSALVGHDEPSHSLAAQALRGADWVTCVSAASLASACAVVPEIRGRSSVIYKGPLPPVVSPLPLPFREPQLLCVGRLVPVKGFDIAVRAFARVLTRFPDAHLVIAGDGTAREELERLASEIGVRARVSFRGWVDPGDVPALMNAATLVMISSRHEGLPQVALESGLMARPVVATCVGGLPEAIIHERTGLLVEPENAAALADGVAALLGAPERAVQLGQAARKRVLDVFGWERYVDAYDALYRRLMVRQTP